MLDLLLKGGVVLLPIVILSVIALALIIERSIFFLRIREDNSDLGGHIVEQLRKGHVAEVIFELQRNNSPEAAVLLEGLKARREKQAPETIHLRMESRALRNLGELEKNVPYLSSIANLATLLGLLGTVTGMIISFLNLKVSGISDPALLAGGISQALITTAAGLTVAIPCLLFFHIFRQIVNKTISRMEIASSELLSFLSKFKSNSRSRPEGRVSIREKVNRRDAHREPAG